MIIEAIRAASARVTAAGQPYEIVPQSIDGVAFRVFKNAPANLRELYGPASCTPTKTSTFIRTSATRSTIVATGGARRSPAE